MFADTLYLTPSEKKWLIDNPIVYIGVDSNWKPIEYIKNEEFVGYSIDLLYKISKLAGFDIEFVQVESYANMQTMIDNKQVSMFSSLFKTNQRENFLYFTDSYINLPFAICSLGQYDNLYSLKGKKVAILKGYAIGEIIETDYPMIEIVYFNSYNEVFDALYSNKVDAFVDVHEFIDNYIFENNHKNIFINMVFDYSMGLSFGISKNEFPLYGIFQKSLKKLKVVELNDLKAKWLGVSLFSNDYYLFRIALLIILLCLFVYLYILKSNKYN